MSLESGTVNMKEEKVMEGVDGNVVGKAGDGEKAEIFDSVDSEMKIDDDKIFEKKVEEEEEEVNEKSNEVVNKEVNEKINEEKEESRQVVNEEAGEKFEDDSREGANEEVTEELYEETQISQQVESLQQYSSDEEIPDVSSNISDSSSDSSSESSDSSSDSSDSDSESETVHNEALEEEEEEVLDGPIKSKNELAEEPAPKLADNYTIEESTPIELIGVIHTFSENNMIIKGTNSAEFRVIKENTVLCYEDRTPVGLMFEVFGPLKAPFYRVKLSESSDIAVKHGKGTPIYYVVPSAQFEITERIRAFKGCDASNINDEEIPEEEMEFSDDAAEADHKKSKKKRKRKKNTGGREVRPYSNTSSEPKRSFDNFRREGGDQRANNQRSNNQRTVNQRPNNQGYQSAYEQYRSASSQPVPYQSTGYLNYQRDPQSDGYNQQYQYQQPYRPPPPPNQQFFQQQEHSQPFQSHYPQQYQPYPPAFGNPNQGSLQGNYSPVGQQNFQPYQQNFQPYQQNFQPYQQQQYYQQQQHQQPSRNQQQNQQSPVQMIERIAEDPEQLSRMTQMVQIALQKKQHEQNQQNQQ